MTDTRIDELEDRLRMVEVAVVELSLMAKYMRYLVLIVAAGVGIDVGGLV